MQVCWAWQRRGAGQVAIADPKTFNLGTHNVQSANEDNDQRK